MACQQCNECITLWLLENGADPDVSDRGGITPTQLASIARMNDVSYVIDSFHKPPPKPQSPYLIFESENKLKVIIIPEPVPVGCYPITRYEIQYGSRYWGEWITLDDNVPAGLNQIGYVIPNLNNSIQYVCRIRSHNSRGWSEYSQRSMGFSPNDAPKSIEIASDPCILYF